MKKKLFLGLILLFESVVLFFAILSLYLDSINSIIVISQMAWAGRKLLSLGWRVSVLLTINNYLAYPVIVKIIGLLIVNVICIVIYYAIFGPLTIVFRKKNERKRREIVPKYQLTNLEKEKLDEKNFIRRFPKGTVISFIFPVLLIALFIIIRFDKVICEVNGSKLNGTLDISNKYIEPFLSSIATPASIHDFFTYRMGMYIKLVTSFLNNVPWVEYVLLFVGSIIILGLWLLVFFLIGLIFKKPLARRRSKLAKRRYIEKMEKIEYRLHKKYKDETSVKADDFISIVEEEQNTPATSISNIDAYKENDKKGLFDRQKKAYLEEIGYGVTDLGITKDNEEVTKPITEREVRYISDEDVDIILEEEPVIEVVEEDDVTDVNPSIEDELFFEKYEADENVSEDSSGVSQDVEDYILKNTQVEENEEKDINNEEVLNDKENNSLQEEIKEEKVEEQQVVEEILLEDIAPQIDIGKEEPKKNDPFAAYRGMNHGKHSATKVPSFKEQGKLDVEEKTNEPIKKNDPFAQYRNKKNKGYGAKKVPSFKELNKNQVVEETPNTPKEEKTDPFAAYRNKKKSGYGAKKVPSFKEIKSNK